MNYTHEHGFADAAPKTLLNAAAAQRIDDSLSAKLERIHDLASKVSQSAEALCERIDGPRAENASEGYPESIPSPALKSVAGRIEDQLRRAAMSLERLHSLT